MMLSLFSFWLDDADSVNEYKMEKCYWLIRGQGVGCDGIFFPLAFCVLFWIFIQQGKSRPKLLGRAKTAD